MSSDNGQLAGAQVTNSDTSKKAARQQRKSTKRAARQASAEVPAELVPLVPDGKLFRIKKVGHDPRARAVYLIEIIDKVQKVFYVIKTILGLVSGPLSAKDADAEFTAQVESSNKGA